MNRVFVGGNITTGSSCLIIFFSKMKNKEICLLQCLKQYVELLIKEGLESAISCPDSACPKRGHLLENEVSSLNICHFWQRLERLLKF